ncbi:phage protein [Oceanimonas sp. GK1]|uniref:phage tail protein n=1 Tax=Oceanimonas sp. (strain GK1 / IBRC-M 10197) TaxID=511062 RepID=UPI0002495379|nr:phage tail protein [Oceanimonas sp. GK1]AEY01472.1 phage protein [Oceanimonas sp. GK1]
MDKHQQQAPELTEHTAPWWMDGREQREPHFLSKGLNAFWQKARNWLLFPLRQLDPLECSEAMLDLLAWDRGIQRFNNEPLSLYRKRVKYAFANARDAGDVAGFKRIFERLGIGWVEVHERQPNQPWDVITIELADMELAGNQPLLQVLLQHYGRTCRRYRFQVVYPKQLRLHAARFSGSYQVFGAKLG